MESLLASSHGWKPWKPGEVIGETQGNILLEHHGKSLLFLGGVYEGKSTGKTYPSQLSPAFAFPPHQRQAVPSCAKLHIVEWCAEAKLGGSLRQSEVRMDSSQHCEPKKVDRESRIKNLATWTSYRNN